MVSSQHNVLALSIVLIDISVMNVGIISGGWCQNSTIHIGAATAVDFAIATMLAVAVALVAIKIDVAFHQSSQLIFSHLVNAESNKWSDTAYISYRYCNYHFPTLDRAAAGRRRWMLLLMNDYVVDVDVGAWHYAMRCHVMPPLWMFLVEWSSVTLLVAT